MVNCLSRELSFMASGTKVVAEPGYFGTRAFHNVSFTG